MPNTVYQCMHCGSIFDTLSQACECENKHVKAERIFDQHINPDNYKEIPDLLVIEMSVSYTHLRGEPSSYQR